MMHFDSKLKLVRQPSLGLTLTELVVVFAVVAMLLAIVSLAILRARQSSATLDCKNNLRQIGLATQSFVQARNAFPLSRQFPTRRGMILLLPYLDQQALYEQLQQQEDDEVWWPVSPIFRCEADPLTSETTFLNYIPCGGVGYGSDRPDEVGFWHIDNHSYGQVIDGLSNTAFYSERTASVAVFPNTFAEASKRYPIVVGDYFERLEQFELACWREFDEKNLNMIRPVTPAADILVQYPFGTRFTPNGPSCAFASTGQTPPNLDTADWESYTPSSNHDGFVNVSFGDGAIHSISNEIDAGIWRSVGTIAGRDGTFVP